MLLHSLRPLVVGVGWTCYLRSVKLLEEVIQGVEGRRALGRTDCPVRPEQGRWRLAGAAVHGRASGLMAAKGLRLGNSCGGGGADRKDGGRGSTVAGGADAISSGL